MVLVKKQVKLNPRHLGHKATMLTVMPPPTRCTMSFYSHSLHHSNKTHLNNGFQKMSARSKKLLWTHVTFNSNDPFNLFFPPSRLLLTFFQNFFLIRSKWGFGRKLSNEMMSRRMDHPGERYWTHYGLSNPNFLQMVKSVLKMSKTFLHLHIVCSIGSPSKA